MTAEEPTVAVMEALNELADRDDVRNVLALRTRNSTGSM